jgi:hypothetical protein
MPFSLAEQMVMVGTPPDQAKVLSAVAIAGTASKPQVIAQAAISAPPATDLATAQTLANATATAFNALLVALKA